MATPEDMATALKEHSLANVIHDIGYAFTASVEVCKNNMLNFDARELTTVDVAKTISAMIRYRSSSQDGLQIQMPGNFWKSLEKDTISLDTSEWNAEVFVQAVKEVVPNLNWKDVVLQLDHQQFIVLDSAALNLLFTILRLGLRSAGYPPNIFPIEYFYRRWTNLEGQMSMISNIIKNPDVFSFADHPYNQVSIDFLKSYPETENKEIGTWRSLHLVELLLYAAEHGYYVLVTELFKIPLQLCPDVLFLVLMQINPPITPVRQELLKILIPIFLGDHPNSGMIICRAWHSQNLNVKSIIMHAMADWYLRGECDHFRLSRILDIAQDLKALSLLLNMQSYPFVIDLACLASRREYLKLDKWLTDKIRENGETFIAALVHFSQKRYPILFANKRPDSQIPKTAQLPYEMITTILACLQMCIPNVQQELQEVIYTVISEYQVLVLNKTRYMRNHETSNEHAGFGAQSLVTHSDPIAMLTPNIGSMSLGPSNNTALPMYDISGSPSKPMMGATNSPSTKIPLQYNANVANIAMRGRVTPAMALEKPRNQDPIPYPETTHSVPIEIEDEANSYFKRIYNHPAHQSLSIDEALDMLKKFQDSPNKREREVFSYMLQNLFEEYKFFPQYPDKELHTTAQLFGGIIEKGLVPSYVSLGLALGFVLDALKKGEGTKMYYFGIAALDRFKSRLKDYHKYCEHVRAIPYFNKFPRHLVEYVEYGLKSQEPPIKPQGLGLDENAVSVSTPYSDFLPRSVVTTPSMSVVPEMTTTGSASRPSIANVTNINTLLTATEESDEVTIPPEAIQDKTAFIFNNLSQLNLQVKCEELKKIITQEYFPWLSRYLVMNRVSIELNFHTLYANFLDVFKVQEMNKLVSKETYRNIKVLLRSDKEISNFTDRSLLKNFGHWLGLLTLARNLPVLYVDIDLKALLLEAYHRGRQDLLYIVPFVAKVLQSCSKSVVFKPPNPWTIALMNVLAELHQEPNLELNLKFEVEVLCKNLSLDVADLKPAFYLKDKNKVKTIKLQLSSQPIKEHEDVKTKPAIEMMSPQPIIHRQETPAPVMPTNQPSVPTQMLQPAEPAFTELVPNDPALMDMLGLPEPRFNYHDINVTSTAIGHNILFNANIILFQNYPHLKQLVKPAIERSIQEWIHPVVDRAIKYALTTCEQIVRKDFALDPDEMRMRTCAHNMMRNLTAGMAMITCREQVTLTISANLKAAFTAAIIPATPHQDAIEDAATTIAADNMELACAFIQKTAVEKALPEVDKCLLSDYEIRKLAREEGRRYYDPIELTYQTEMIPERCRMRVGAPTDLSVYEEFARKIPGFAPVTDASLFTLKPAPDALISQHLPYNPVMTPSQVYGTDEMDTLITAAEIYLGSALTAALARNMHALLECLCLERRNRDIVSRCTLLQKAIEGLLNLAQPATADLETTRYRDIHLRVLKVLEAVYGHLWTSKQVTCCLTECREEIRYNVEAVDCLIRNGLVIMPQYDIALAHMMDNGNNYTAIAFAMQLVQIYLDQPTNTIVTESDLHHTKDTLSRVITHSRQLEGLTPLIETVRADVDIGSLDGKKSLLGPTAHIHSEVMQVRSKTYDDPPGLKEKTETFLKDWNNFLLSPLTEINLQRNFNLYIHHMNMNPIFSSVELTTRFLRISVRMCIENVYEELSKDRMNPPNDSARREKYYVMCDSFVKLVSMMIKNIEGGNPTPKLNLLNKVLGIITGCLLRDHEERGTSFQQLPYHRLLLMLLFDMTLEPTLDSINCQVVTSFWHAFHIVRPAVAAGFSFSWLEIVSHRVLIDRVLADNPQQKGWGMYSTLVIDLFKFLEPFLRNNEVAPPVMTLYKGTLKVLLVLLHDFPEFLCDYHYAFCDVISPNCIQMRNLVLSAFPRNMRMPDPFTPNLKVDLLCEIALPPRTVVNYATLLPNTQFKKDLDTYLNARAPVTFLSELRRNMQVVNDSVRRYNSQLMNAVVLYVGTQAIASIRSKGEVPRMATIAHSAYMDIFQNISVDFDDEGRYLFLNAIANQLRYPNSHTHYFSCVLLYLFAEANSETIQVQITRMLLERLIVNRPHPWGVLITFIELIKNPVYKFWQREFVNYVPEIEHYEKLPSLYNYIVEKVICKISGRKEHNYEADTDT